MSPERIARQIGLLDPRDGGIADTEHWHLSDCYFGRNSLVKVAGEIDLCRPFRLQIGEGRARLRFGHMAVLRPDLADGLVGLLVRLRGSMLGYSFAMSAYAALADRS